MITVTKITVRSFLDFLDVFWEISPVAGLRVSHMKSTTTISTSFGQRRLWVRMNRLGPFPRPISF